MIYKLLTFIIFLLLIVSCSDTYTPKPRGYFRIEFPDKEYVDYNGNEPYTFKIPKYSYMKKDSSEFAEEWWNNLVFPTLKGKLHLSYKRLNNNLNNFVEDSRMLAYKHTIKADAIEEQVFINNHKKVYGILYEIKGNAASPFQFFATDSTQHFLRGSLYFNVYPNKDSLAPVFDFIKKDILVLIESIEWKN
ncbi:MAG: gliding motility lipoprotein GldD [Bacteroidales bacterium]|nr:gliding motility lipoprotein GldD [Bacteroidales bacterium]